MVLVVIIAVAWLVILIPGFLRRRSASGETDSISHFHQQLRILEHSAPMPIVPPPTAFGGADGERLECARPRIAGPHPDRGRRPRPAPPGARLPGR